MEIIQIKTSQLIPYENNPRQNKDAVPAVMKSIQEFGFKVPIVIDKNNVIVAGHTRVMAAQKLGMDSVPCIIADDLTDEQIRAFRLADNKTAELAEWDLDLLGKELAGITGIDMTQFGFEVELEEIGDKLEKEPYSMKANIPQYEITGDCPALDELLDTKKGDELIAEIMQSNVSDAEKDFLIHAARRHNVFNYRNIAEYYAHATPEMQRLMEKSALVVIDIGDAITFGYAQLHSDVWDMMEQDYLYMMGEDYEK